MRKILLAALMAFTANVQAGLSYFDGNKFFGASEVAKLAYVQGIADAHATLKGELFCVPQNATAGQITDVAKKYLNDHPEDRHLTASSLILFSLKQAFPCK